MMCASTSARCAEVASGCRAAGDAEEKQDVGVASRSREDEACPSQAASGGGATGMVGSNESAAKEAAGREEDASVHEEASGIHDKIVGCEASTSEIPKGAGVGAGTTGTVTRVATSDVGGGNGGSKIDGSGCGKVQEPGCLHLGEAAPRAGGEGAWGPSEAKWRARAASSTTEEEEEVEEGDGAGAEAVPTEAAAARGTGRVMSKSESAPSRRCAAPALSLWVSHSTPAAGSSGGAGMAPAGASGTSRVAKGLGVCSCCQCGRVASGVTSSLAGCGWSVGASGREDPQPANAGSGGAGRAGATPMPAAAAARAAMAAASAWASAVARAMTSARVLPIAAFPTTCRDGLSMPAAADAANAAAALLLPHADHINSAKSFDGTADGG